MGLDRIREVMAAMGLASPGFSTILVGGTNGKGSCVALLHQILSEEAYQVGAYTSPHLVRYNERIRIADRLANDDELIRAFEAIEQARGDIPLTYFEFGTLAAVKLFHDNEMDVVVMEVGMGGRLDAVNALEPQGVLLTNVGLDHQAWLGETREKIGWEKAGIFRTGVPAVCADPDAPASVLEAAEQTRADFALVNREYIYRIEDGQWEWSFDGKTKQFPRPALRGDFQVSNAAAVTTLLSMLEHKIPVSDDSIRRGLERVRLPGRLQVLKKSPLRIADVAHNRESAAELAAFLRTLTHSGKTIAVCGMLQDKPVGDVFALMSEVVDEWHLGTIDDKRGASADELAESLSRISLDIPVHSYPSIRDAWRSAISGQGTDDVLLIFGSFYSVGDILSLY